MDKPIKLDVNGRQMTFQMTLGAYNRYLNDVQPTSKTGPAHNLCMRTVTDDCKTDLQELLQVPSMGVRIASHLIEEYTPDIEIEVGK